LPCLLKHDKKTHYDYTRPPFDLTISTALAIFPSEVTRVSTKALPPAVSASGLPSPLAESLAASNGSALGGSAGTAGIYGRAAQGSSIINRAVVFTVIVYTVARYSIYLHRTGVRNQPSPAHFFSSILSLLTIRKVCQNTLLTFFQLQSNHLICF